jgi:hypothetical protein
MSATQTDDDDVVPYDVTEEVEVGDLSDQESGVLPASSRVIGEVKKASVKTNLENNKYPQADDNEWTFKSLHLEIGIGPLGIDGEGAYANKVLFADLIVSYNDRACERKAVSAGKKYNRQWWEREARYPAKQFIRAIGGDVTNVRINDDFLISLLGVSVMFDIKKVKDTFRGEGEFKNELANWRAVENSEE